MLRSALRGQGPKLPSLHALPRQACRGLLLVLQDSGGFAHRLPQLNLPDPTDNRKGFLPALQDRVPPQESH
jgi:hypothetical protein